MNLSFNQKKALNPYLPSWEYVPDGEPHVFGDRVYVYGSHDFFNGWVFCLGDYVCWSAPLSDLSDWRYEGVIYKRTDDPINEDGRMVLYAPDICQGPDGRYYLYYFYDKRSCINVAVSDKPEGPFVFYGRVRDDEGGLIGERYGDEPYFDPAVLVEGNYVYLYGGFCGQGDKSRTGCMVTVLDARDMLTVIEEPAFVIPGNCYSKGTGYEGHAFFEAPSIRKIGKKYVLVYSSERMCELCYAVSDSPDEDFEYKGCIVCNNDTGIDSYKPADVPTAYGGNNHGGLVQIGEDWYIFYHRQTNGTWYSRQGCAEKVSVSEDALIPQVEMTSCGLSDSPLEGKGFIPAYIACNLFTEKNMFPMVGMGAGSSSIPKITQDGRDGDEEPGYIAGFSDGVTAGFKYFELKGVKKVSVISRGYGNGRFDFATEMGGKPVASVPVSNTNFWEMASAEGKFPDGTFPIYITYRGDSAPSLLGFVLE